MALALGLLDDERRQESTQQIPPSFSRFVLIDEWLIGNSGLHIVGYIEYTLQQHIIENNS